MNAHGLNLSNYQLQPGFRWTGTSPIDPAFDPYPVERAVDEACRDLDNDQEAIALARIAKVAGQEGKRIAGENFSIIDCFNLANDALEHKVFEAAQANDLERDQLPATGEIVKRLAGGEA